MIRKQELLKLAKMPIIPILIVFFIVLNAFIIMSQTYFKQELSILTEMVETYGYEINDKMMNKIEADYQEKVKWVNQIAPDDTEVYEHPSQLLSEDSIHYDQELSEQNYRQLLDEAMFEGYYRTAQDIDDVYHNLDLASNAETLIQRYGLTGSAAEEVRTQYQTLDTRLDQLKENKEHKNLFFMGKSYEMHSFLFRNIGLVLIFELMILVVLITAAITNYEFEQRTSLVTYTTTRGRKLVIDKLLAALMANGCIILGLIGVTLIMFFLTYDYSGLWHVPISSYFNAEMPLPYISWWNLSFIEYLGIFILLIILSQLLFMGITFILSVYIKNTYLVFFTFAILLGLGIIIPSLAPMSSRLVFWLHFNPFALILNPHEWLMGNGPFTIHPYYEAITIGVWVFLLGSMGCYSMYRFYQQSLH